MFFDDPDPARRWNAVSAWYAHFANVPGWEFLSPMVDLTQWVHAQPFAGEIFPGQSHEWLCVALRPGWRPRQPFFKCKTRRDGKFEARLWKMGRFLARDVVPLDRHRDLFVEFAEKLNAATA